MADEIRTGLDWEDLRVFVALARHGSLSAAARALSVTHATVARRIASLEEALREKLVERRPDGYVLTASGQRVLAAASDMETAAATLGRQGGDHVPAGLVRVNATPGLAQGFLIARLASFAAKHAALDIEVASDIRNVSLERREADIAIRFGRPQDGDVIAKRLARVDFGFYATSAWCRRVDKGSVPVFVGFEEGGAHLPEATWLARHFPRSRIAFRATNQFAQATAVREGAGIALLPHFIGRGDARLQLCDLGPLPPAREFWMLTRRQDSKTLPIRTVTDYLVQVFSDESALFERTEG